MESEEPRRLGPHLPHITEIEGFLPLPRIACRTGQPSPPATPTRSQRLSRWLRALLRPRSTIR